MSWGELYDSKQALAAKVFEFSNDCHNASNGQFCETHGVTHTPGFVMDEGKSSPEDLKSGVGRLAGKIGRGFKKAGAAVADTVESGVDKVQEQVAEHKAEKDAEEGRKELEAIKKLNAEKEFVKSAAAEAGVTGIDGISANSSIDINKFDDRGLEIVFRKLSADRGVIAEPGDIKKFVKNAREAGAKAGEDTIQDIDPEAISAKRKKLAIKVAKISGAVITAPVWVPLGALAAVVAIDVQSGGAISDLTGDQRVRDINRNRNLREINRKLG